VEITVDLIDKVVLYKGRVWTIYSISSNTNNVLAYQGLKPFSSFNYYKDTQKYSSFKKNITCINHDEINILTGDGIAQALKKEAREMKKHLSRKKAIDFYVYFTGHSKSFVSKHIIERYRGFEFSPGAVRYELWKHERGERSFLLLSNNMEGNSHHSYFDFITFETDEIETERSWEAVKEEIIDNFKEWKGIQ
jgi:hypothetical protein